MQLCYPYIGPFAWWAELTEAERAAWIQAVATMIALAVAVFAPIWHANRTERRRTSGQIASIVSMSEDVCMLLRVGLDELKEDAQSYIKRDMPITVLRSQIEILRAVVLHELGDARLTVPVFEFTRVVQSFVEQGERLRVTARDAGIDIPPDVVEAIVDLVDYAADPLLQMRDIRAEYDSRLVRLWRWCKRRIARRR